MLCVEFIDSTCHVKHTTSVLNTMYRAFPSKSDGSIWAINTIIDIYNNAGIKIYGNAGATQ